MVGSGKDTILVIHDGQHLLAGGVSVRQALFRYHVTRLGRHLGQQLRHELLDDAEFLIRNRCTRITLYAATATAYIQIAAEFFFHHIQADQCILYHEHKPSTQILIPISMSMMPPMRPAFSRSRLPTMTPRA